jgi:hypothetical protein
MAAGHQLPRHLNLLNGQVGLSQGAGSLRAKTEELRWLKMPIAKDESRAKNFSIQLTRNG